jgi:Holliday junction resolvase RusA-like endonuclease
MTISLEISGQPVPQPRHRVPRFGKPYIEDRHPIHAYRAAIVALAAGKKIGRGGPVRLSIEAVFARPPSHWLKDGLKKNALRWPRGDGDNVAKGVADALTDAGVWTDDDCVVDWRIVKRYGARKEAARTLIVIEELGDAYT